MKVRVVAGTYVVLGMAVACFALYALALDPATFRQLQLQMAKESDPRPPEPGQTDCAPTAAEAMQMRADAVVLLLLAAAQTVTAMAAVVGTGRLGATLAMCLSMFTAWRLHAVFVALLNVAIGRCHHHGDYHQVLVACYAVVAVPSALLLLASLFVILDLGAKLHG